MTFKERHLSSVLRENNHVIAFCGDCDFQLKEALDLIRGAFFCDKLSDFNYDKMDLRKHSEEEVVLRAKTVPFMHKKRLIEVFNCNLVNFYKGNPIYSYINGPVETTLMVLIYDKIDLKREEIKLLRESKLVFSFSAPKSYQMPGLTKEASRKIGLNLKDDAVLLVSILAETDLMYLKNILEKLYIVFASIPVSVKEISPYLTNTSRENAFKLADYLSLEDYRGALLAVRQLRDSGDSIFDVINMVAWQYRLILKISVFLRKGQPCDQLKNKLSLDEKKFNIILRAARLNSIKSWLARLLVLQEVYFNLKNGNFPDWIYFEKKVIFPLFR